MKSRPDTLTAIGMEPAQQCLAAQQFQVLRPVLRLVVNLETRIFNRRFSARTFMVLS
jgi:hypothetical protein